MSDLNSGTTPSNALFSSWLFWRAYAAALLGIIAIALLLDALLGTFIHDDDDEALLHAYTPLLSLVGSELAGLDVDARARRLKALAKQPGLPLELIPVNQFAGSPDLTQQLQAGTPQLFYSNSGAPVLYQKLPGSASVLMLGPLPDERRSSTRELMIICIYYTLIALVLLLWIWPFYRDLRVLRLAAVAFGKTDFTTRVKLGSNSSILPVALAFNTMAERIDSLVSSHRELTHAVSHELRTPLARSKFSLEMLTRNPDPSRKQAYIDNIKADVAELETLIDELLGYARLSEENLILKRLEIDLQHWLQQEVAIYSQERIIVSCSFAATPLNGDHRVSCNPELLARAIHNIIRNALRYANEQIRVHAQLNAERILIIISDDGPGIPVAKHNTIFEPFSRLETSRDRQSGGHGLGLAIASRILQRHGGSILVENCEPQGACFKLIWPRKNAN